VKRRREESKDLKTYSHGHESEQHQGYVECDIIIEGFWYVECDIISPKLLRESALIQLPVVRGNTPSTHHQDNVWDLFNNIFNKPVTLADIGISEQRTELAMQAIAEVWTTGICNVLENGKSLHDMLFTYLSQTPEVINLRQQEEEQQALERA
jgi:hypothetical protein